MRRNRKEHLIPLERSRRIIQIERRGHTPGGHPVLAGIFGMLGILCVIYCIGIAITGFGTYFFLIWGAIGACSLALAAILQSGRAMNAIPVWIKGAFCALFCVGLLVFGAVEARILSQYGAEASPGADYIIILGAQWKSTGPSEVLRRRLDRAIDYLEQNPDTKAIVTGGTRPSPRPWGCGDTSCRPASKRSASLWRTGLPAHTRIWCSAPGCWIRRKTAL